MKKIMCFCLCALMIFGTIIGVSAESEEISLGAKYDLITPASESYADDGKKLTDGMYGMLLEGTNGYYANGAYVGFNKSDANADGNFSIIIDLGKIHKNIKSITIGYLSEREVGICAPESVTFSVSNVRNGNYKTLGVLDTEPENVSVAATYAKTFETNDAEGRFILVTITPGNYMGKVETGSIAPWTFIDEISVHREDPENPLKDEENKDETDKDEQSDGSGAATSDEEDKDEKPDSPQTGDASNILGFVFLGLSAIAMGIALFTKPSRDNF